jgi:hypothetical protein
MWWKIELEEHRILVTRKISFIKRINQNYKRPLSAQKLTKLAQQEVYPFMCLKRVADPIEKSIFLFANLCVEFRRKVVQKIEQPCIWSSFLKEVANFGIGASTEQEASLPDPGLSNNYQVPTLC